MKSWEIVAIDVDGARYCLDCAPMTGDEATEQGIGGVVFADQMEETDYCSECMEELG